MENVYLFKQTQKTVLKSSNITLGFVQPATKSHEISHRASLHWAYFSSVSTRKDILELDVASGCNQALKYAKMENGRKFGYKLYSCHSLTMEYSSTDGE